MTETKQYINSVARRTSFILVLAALMVVFSGQAKGAIEIVLDNGVPATGYRGGDTVWADSSVRFDIRFTYTPSTQDTIKGFTNAFRIWTYANGTTNYTDNFAPITYDSIALNWQSMCDLIFVMLEFNVDGVGEDTIAFAGFRQFADGIVAPFDSVVWWIETTPTTDGDTLCIDSSWFPPTNEWIWSTSAGDFCDIPLICPAGVLPWGGPYCFTVFGGCCVEIRGNADGDPGDQANVVDLTYLVDYLFRSGPPPPCFEEGDVNGDGNINVADVTYLVDYLFRSGPPPPPCP